MGGVLRQAGSADRRAQNDARVRQHAPDGGAPDAASVRSARRGRGHGTSRQPVERTTSRRRSAIEDGTAAGARGNGIAGAGHRHRSCRSRLSDRIAAPDCHPAAAGRPFRPHGCRASQGTSLSGLAGRPRRVRGAAAIGPPWRPRRHRPARCAARRAGAADRRRVDVPRVWRRGAVRPRPTGVAVSQPRSSGFRRRRSHDGRRILDETWAAGGAGAPR